MLQATTSAPGEYFEGHLERIHRFNGLKTRRATYQWLVALADANTGGAWRENPAVRLSLLAAFENVPLLDYCLEHTALQYQVFCRSLSRWSLDAMSVKPILRKAKGNRDSVFMCQECARADKGKAGPGYPYIRVKHQIPGVSWCVDHFQPLLTCDVAAQPLGCEPSCILQDVTPLMRRFAEISVAMLVPSSTIETNTFRRLLRFPAESLGLKQRKNKANDAREFLSCRIQGKVDGSWLEDLFPGYRRRTKSEAFWPIDGPLWGMPNSAAAHALSLAYVFETTKDALNCIEEMRTSKRVVSGLNLLDDDEVYAAYVHNHGNLRRMSDQLGWKRSALSHLSTKGLPSLHRNSLIAPAIRDVLYKRTSVKVAARRHQVSLDKLTDLLKRGGDRLLAAIQEIDHQTELAHLNMH